MHVKLPVLAPFPKGEKTQFEEVWEFDEEVQ